MRSNWESCGRDDRRAIKIESFFSGEGLGWLLPEKGRRRRGLADGIFWERGAVGQSGPLLLGVDNEKGGGPTKQELDNCICEGHIL